MYNAGMFFLETQCLYRETLSVRQSESSVRHNSEVFWRVRCDGVPQTESSRLGLGAGRN